MLEILQCRVSGGFITLYRSVMHWMVGVTVLRNSIGNIHFILLLHQSISHNSQRPKTTCETPTIPSEGLM